MNIDKYLITRCNEINNYLIPILTAVIGWYGNSVYTHLTKKEDRWLENDLKLYDKFIKDYPSESGFISKLIDLKKYGNILYLRDDLLHERDVYYFDLANQWASPERRFYNNKVEQKKIQFLEKVLGFSNCIGMYYFLRENQFIYIKQEDWDDDYQKPPKKDKIDLDAINAIIDSIVEKHREFINAARNL